MSERENTEVAKEKSYDWLDDVIEESGMLNTFHKLDVIKASGIQYVNEHMINEHRDSYDAKTNYKPITEFEDHELKQIVSEILSEVGSLYIEDETFLRGIRAKLYHKTFLLTEVILRKLRPKPREKEMFLSPPEKGWSKI